MRAPAQQRLGLVDERVDGRVERTVATGMRSPLPGRLNAAGFQYVSAASVGHAHRAGRRSRRPARCATTSASPMSCCGGCREPADGLYLAESAKVIERALAAGHRPRSVLLQQKWLDELAPLLEPYDVPGVPRPRPRCSSSSPASRCTAARSPRCTARRCPPVADVLRDARRVVVLEDIVDHTNVGAIFRAVAGLGADAVLITPRCADPLYRRAVRVSMGTVLQIPWTRLDGVAGRRRAAARRRVRDRGARPRRRRRRPRDVRAASTRPGRPAARHRGRRAQPAGLAAADTVVTIPMSRGVDSLNVAAASAVALWALRR